MIEIKNSAHILGALFYYGPTADETQGIINSFQTGVVENILPNINIKKWLAAMNATPLDELKYAWQSMFVGPGYLSAPPWGSVYLDPENVVFGISLLELREFMVREGLLFEKTHNEPEDQFGLMLLLLAEILKREQTNADLIARELLIVHFLPWAPRYLECLCRNAKHPFIIELGEYAQMQLEQWIDKFELIPTDRTLYWPVVPLMIAE